MKRTENVKVSAVKEIMNYHRLGKLDRMLRVGGICTGVLLASGSIGLAQESTDIVDGAELAERYPFAAGGQIFFSGGGSLPPYWQVEEEPSPLPLESSSGAWKVELLTIQHTYAANFDIDLAPATLADGDNFEDDTKSENGEQTLEEIFLEGGSFRDYEVTEFTEDLQELIHTPNWPKPVSPGGAPSIATDGYFKNEDHAYLIDNVNREKFEAPDPNDSNKIMVTCNIGAQLLTGRPSPANIVQAGQSLPTNTLPDELVVARNGNYSLVTGPLASFWGAEPVLADPYSQWVVENFGGVDVPFTGPEEDFDKDLVSNQDEWVIGSNPTMRDADFLNLRFGAEQASVILQWRGVPGRRYTIRYSADLAPDSWVTIDTVSYEQEGMSFNTGFPGPGVDNAAPTTYFQLRIDQ